MRPPGRMLSRFESNMGLDDDIERILFRETEIGSAIDRIAADVTRLYEGRNLTVVSVLKGSCVFVSDLIRRLPIPLELTFVGVSSYRSGTRSGDLEIQFLPSAQEIEGRDVLVVDDILDTGRTLDFIRRELLRRGALEVQTCAFLDKPSRRKIPIEADFLGFVIEDLFVVGYGLDFAGRYRNLPYVGTLRAEILSALRETSGKDP